MIDIIKNVPIPVQLDLIKNHSFALVIIKFMYDEYFV